MKPQKRLSVTRLSTFSMCPALFYFRYVLGIKKPPTVPLAKGIIVHEMIEHNYRTRMETGNDLADADLLTIATDKFNGQKGGIDFQDKKEEDVLADIHLSIVTYQKDLAPKIKPSVVEWQVDWDFEGIPFTGKIDVIDQEMTIRDTKTCSRAPFGSVMAKDIQMTAYAIAFEQATGLRAKKVCRDYIIPGKEPRVETYLCEKTSNDVDMLKRITYGVLNAIENNAFYPNYSNMMCSKKSCQYWNECHGDWESLKK